MEPKPPAPSDLLKVVNDGLSLAGLHLPPWLNIALGLLLIVVALTAALAAIFVAIAKIKEVWTQHLRPNLLSPEERERAAGREKFADYIKLELKQRDQRENWSDERFTELEAEVQAEGRRRGLPLWFRGRGARREPSLSAALEGSHERLILLLGDPGSGKSVAMRHVAHDLAANVLRFKGFSGKLPVYVNLKEIKLAPHEKISHEIIRRFVLASLNRSNDKKVGEYLDRYFEEGVSKNEWVFLFDSFDEIPEILSSTEVDSAILQYSLAISDFLGGLNKCRGVVASRVYRGPTQSGWRSFRILELSLSRQASFIRRSLPFDMAEKVRSDLAAATDDVRIMARNPLLLGLLCEHVKLGHLFPRSAHETISRFIDGRLARDQDRLTAQFRLDAPELRAIAEAVAFSMTADFGVGLSPQVDALAQAISLQNFALPADRLMRGLGALEMMHLGRITNAAEAANGLEFTFTHRRFQEFFATCVVVNQARSVPAERLLTDARWRETGVVMLQTASPVALAPIVQAAASILPEDAASAPVAEPENQGTREQTAAVGTWAPGQLHILSILQAGSGAGSDRLPRPLRVRAAGLLRTAFATGTLLDRKLALEVAAVAPQEEFADLLKQGLTTQSQWLSEIVYVQSARLIRPVPEVYASIRAQFSRLALSFGLKREYHSTKYYVARLPESRTLLRPLQLAKFVRPIDLLLFPIVLTICLIIRGGYQDAAILVAMSMLAFLLSCFFLDVSGAIGWLIALTLRCGLATIPPLLLLDSNSFTITATAVLGICALSWLPGAILCIRDGKFCSIVGWPFVHAHVLFRFFGLILTYPVLFSALFIVFCFEILVLGFLESVSTVMDSAPVRFGIPAFGAIVWIFILAQLACTFVFWLADRRRLRSAKSLNTSWDAERFQQTFAKMRTVWGRIRLLEEVQAQPLADDKANWSSILEQLISAPARQAQWTLVCQTQGIAALSGGPKEWAKRREAVKAAWGARREANKTATGWGRPFAAYQFSINISVMRSSILAERDLLYKLVEKVQRDGLYAAPAVLGRSVQNRGSASLDRNAG